MKTILCDLDGIVAHLNQPWYDAYNLDYDDDLSDHTVTDWDVHKFVKPECGMKIYSYLTSELFLSLPPLPGAIEGIKTLKAMGFDIKFLTSAPSGCCDAKVTWVKKHLKGFGRKDVITCYYKTLVKGDILIDDGPHNVAAYRKAWPDAHILAISWPYNQSILEGGYANVFAQSYTQTEKAWEEFIKYLEDLKD